MILPGRIQLQSIGLIAETPTQWNTKLDPGVIYGLLKAIFYFKWRRTLPSAEVRFRYVILVMVPNDVLAKAASTL